ncbi:BRO family, N-terminal domain protein [Neisseria sicca ATCC 29256]|uniref:BRO family, N-terminal domain protein n=1 Tax=Neisseria sicca ATCC 29256 TaxID=547045 RepID=C6M4H5_NEISI|nr:Bro-N domain-containing protein [Neisseria sicca]EET44758.1 BRO family, N-terminal domain protein [Neisseria sicca ATCC 29256]
MNQVQHFNFNQSQVRVEMHNGEPLFCLTDVAQILEIQNTKSSRFNLKEDGVHKMYLTDKLGRNQEATFISEPNLYRVIFRSNKAEAIKFQDWIFEEVIPTIRKTGGYQAKSTPSVKDQLPTRDELIQVIYMLGDRLREIHGWGWGNFDDHLSGKFNKTPRESTYDELVNIIRWLHKQTQTVAGRPIVAGVNCPVKPFGIGASLSQQAENLPAMLAAEEKKQLPAPVVVKAADSSDAQCRKREIAESHNSAIARLLTYDGDTSEIGLAECGAATEIVNLTKIVSDAYENFMFCKENQNQTDDNFKCAMLELTRLQNTVMELICC